jgi:TolB-like protein/DNA-binding winged helix-turn-helix (wHTH) protein/Tfp pilus assembly protein PilF
MPGSDGHPRMIRFGAYELDEATHELRKNGLRIHLQDQPWVVLCALLERPGEVVAREDLRRRLWPDGTFVDYEKSLNKAVNKLRDALCDSAETPRYVQTASRRGYRFVAPVSFVSGVAPGPGPDEAPPARAAPPLVARPGRGRWIVAAVSGAVLLIAAVPLALNVGGLRDRLLMALDLKSATPPRIESIAVLPLQNLSHDPEQEYFTDGLTDMLIGDLGKMGTLRVISHTSVMQYKGTRTPLPQIARELNVDAAVEGTVLRSGSRIRITAQLLLARTDTHLWSDVYERDFEDVISLERQVAVAIAHEITGRLSPAQETRLARGRITNPRAYDAYLHGRYLWNQRDAVHTAAAVGYFEQALREDPHFALAYSGLADSYSVSWWSKEDLPLAEEYARKALAFEPDLAEAHASLGIVYAYTSRFPEAEAELRRAIELNPNYAMAHHWWALNLVYFGRFEEALAENDRARQLDPFSLPVNNGRMYALVGLRQYDRAIEQCETLAVLDAARSFAPGWLVRIYWLEGRVPEAVAEARANATLRNSAARLRDLDEIAAAFSRSGLRAAQLKAAQLEELGYKSSYSPLEIAYRYGLAGNRDKVFQWLDTACRDHAPDCLTLRGSPEFDSVRSTPRFRELLRRQGLDW